MNILLIKPSFNLELNFNIKIINLYLFIKAKYNIFN